MVLILVAELLGGETLVSPGGPIDTATCAADDVELWAGCALAGPVEEPAVEAGTAIAGVGAATEPARA
jgi:hypothetical protein